MARSFDIKRRPRPAPALSSPPTRRRRGHNSFLFFFLIIFAGVAVYVLSQTSNSLFPSTQPSNPSTLATNNSHLTPTPSAGAAATTPVPSKTVPTGAPKIQILNGTGSDSVTTAVKQALENKGYPVSDASQAQYQYAQTYIYYRPNSVAAAKDISTILSAYKPTLSESQIAGLFDVLVIVGKQNLPSP